MCGAGVSFYEGNEKVWLADVVPVRFLRVQRSRPMKIRSDENRLDGRWEMIGGKIVADAVCDRIAALVENHLETVATTGWDALYRDPQDGRYWELLYPYSEMHGGGPPSLVHVGKDSIRETYGLNVSR